MIQDIHPHQFNNQYKPITTFNEGDYIIHFRENTVLLKTNGDEPELPQKKDVPGITDKTNTTFLFTLNETACFLVLHELEVNNPQLSYTDISFFRSTHKKEIAWVCLVAFHLRNWYVENKFCGKCGAAYQHKTDERALICTNCNGVIYPKVSPAIIVAILSGNKILLARNVNFKSGMYSLVAGYVDVGETLEETVAREVKEEVGLDVKNIRYYKSQPWSLSGSMMIGFIAEADEAQPIFVDNIEINKAAWFSCDDLPKYPSNISIAGEMIDKFMKGEL